MRVTTGDPNNDGTGGDSNAGGVFSDEYSLNLWHFNGAVAMDNGGAPNQNTSRFFIVQNSEITTELADEMLDGGFPESVVQKYLDVGGVPNYDFRDFYRSQNAIYEKLAGRLIKMRLSAEWADAQKNSCFTAIFYL